MILRRKIPHGMRLSGKVSKHFGLLRNHESAAPETVLNIRHYNPIDVNRGQLKFYIETYGCQMNVNDSDIVRSILMEAGHVAEKDVEKADIILANTCAIRENAEQKIWRRLQFFNSVQRKRRERDRPVVGVLGCMAERLKEKMFEKSNNVSFICGPDAYRDIPRLIDISLTTTDQKAANTALSLEETYADIRPVREASTVEAFVSIMRGCNNMCSYCVVPFTRGRERSRPIDSIIDEVGALVKTGVKEILLLGQNVNSFHDRSPSSIEKYPESEYHSTEGFNNMFKTRNGSGARFVDLLDEVSLKFPEVRFRFTSPHPKDFPEEVLYLIAERPNICSSLHMPAQSGSTSVLESMRRGYTREAYLELIDRARSIIGSNLSISTDMIAGFCGESEEDHKDSVKLMETVKFDQAFMFAYSRRDKTHAGRRLKDDVPEKVKLLRLQEIIETFRRNVQFKNEQNDLNMIHAILVEGPAKKSTRETTMLQGRTDSNKRTLFPSHPVLRQGRLSELTATYGCEFQAHISEEEEKVDISAGHLVAVRITEVKGHTLRAEPIALLNMSEYGELRKVHDFVI